WHWAGVALQSYVARNRDHDYAGVSGDDGRGGSLARINRRRERWAVELREISFWLLHRSPATAKTHRDSRLCFDDTQRRGFRSGDGGMAGLGFARHRLVRAWSTYARSQGTPCRGC